MAGESKGMEELARTFYLLGKMVDESLNPLGRSKVKKELFF